ncbi:MAG: PKD domain-containing protein [Dehalococcoidia bacterium]|nr:PKD domain-containing protein [Dehalococcoidia bacterium]
MPHLAVTSDDPPSEGVPYFAELVPVQASAAAIVVKDAANVQIGQVALGGTAPAVTITSPLGGTLNGVQTVSWSVIDPDSASHTFHVHYSTNGAAWHSLASSLGKSSLKVNLDALPGSGGTSRIRVIASDGVNSGQAVSPPFTVGPKLPEAMVQFPKNGALFAQQQMVVLQGQGYDVDDGFLEGASLQWTSTKDGNLGTGAELPVATLSTGVHVITLKATDSQANQAQDSVTIYVGTQAPADLPEGSPTANPGGPYTGQALASIAFNGAGSTDPESQALTYQWDFGDGQTGTGATPSHAYAVGGTYLVSLTVTDPTALSHAQTTLAMVQQAEPTPTPTPIPGLTVVGVAAMAGLFGALAIWRLRRKTALP